MQPSKADAGFTLIEMLVVMSILALVAALAVPAMRRQGGGVAAQQELLELRGQLQDAHRQAVSSGRQIDVPVPDALTYRPHILSGPADVMEFHADGSSSGGVLLRGERTLLRIDWLSGEVRHGAG